MSQPRLLAARAAAFILVVAATVVPARAQTIEDIRALYAQADYEGALAALDQVRFGTVESDMALAADRLRAFCLLALDRTDAADRVITRIVTAHPAYEPGSEVSPRIRTAFRTLRDRLVPAMARRLYDEGRIAFERGDYAGAVAGFERAVPVLEMLAFEGRPGMEDLRILANGFLVLSRERVPPPVPPAPPALESRAWDVAPSVVWASAAAPAAAAAAGAAGTAGLDLHAPPTQPEIVNQDLPPWTLGLGIANGLSGSVEVRIDERGRVTHAEVVNSVHPSYDQELLRAARDWRYHPATRAGQPVTSHKRVEVVIRSRE